MRAPERGQGRDTCPEDEEESDRGRERESILGMCEGPVEGAWPIQEMGRQPGAGE